MEELAMPLKKGLKKSGEILLLLIKVVIPVMCFVVVLDFYGVLEPLALFFSPLMSLVGLPGEAAIALTFGFFINTFAAVGVITAMSLNATEITILAVMLGISHELFIESAISSYTGLKIPVSFLLRISAAFFSGIFLNVLLNVILGV